MLSKEEKLKKINLQIQTAQSEIAKFKEKIKELKIKRTNLEKQIANEKYSELKSVLKDYGISSVEDFQTFIDTCSNQNTNPN